MWIVEGWVTGPEGRAAKVQVTHPEEPDEKTLDKLRNHVGVAYFLTYRMWPSKAQPVTTKVTQR